MSRRFLIVFALTLLFSTILPLASTHAQMGSPVPCTGDAANPCTFQKLFILIDNVLKYIVKISVPLGAAAIAYAGIQIVISPGDPGKQKQAKSIIWTVVGGLVAILASYLIVKTILNYFVTPDLNQL